MDSLWTQLSNDTTSPTIIHDWVSTVHFCDGYENQAAQELALNNSDSEQSSDHLPPCSDLAGKGVYEISHTVGLRNPSQ